MLLYYLNTFCECCGIENVVERVPLSVNRTTEKTALLAFGILLDTQESRGGEKSVDLQIFRGQVHNHVLGI